MKIYYKELDLKSAKSDDAILLQCTEDEPMDLAYSFAFVDGANKIDVAAFEGSIYKLEDAYYLRGAMAVKIEGTCDRCLAPAKIAVAADVEVNIEPSDMPAPESTLAEYEMTDDDGEIFYSGTKFIDIEEILRQEALLISPVKKLCNKECKGICPTCGVDLNVANCSCTPEGELSKKLSEALLNKGKTDKKK